MGCKSTVKYDKYGTTNPRFLNKLAQLDKQGVPSGDFSKAVNNGQRFFIFAPNQGTMANLNDAIIWAEKSGIDKETISISALGLASENNNYLMAGFSRAADAQKFREHHEKKVPPSSVKDFEVMRLINDMPTEMASEYGSHNNYSPSE